MNDSPSMSTQPNHSEKMHRALALWQRITGVDPNATRLIFGEMDVRSTFALLREAIELDPTEVTAMLLFDHFHDRHMRSTSVSLNELLDEPDAVAQRLAPIKELRTILNAPELVQVRARFTNALAAAMERYDADHREEVQQLLATPHDLAVLRRDALRSMARLRVDQFLAGEPEAAHITPVYHRTVHQWWNINSLLAAATRMPSGVSLNLVRDPEAFQSYFCFVIRNGGRLFVLTDKEALDHPLQAGMRRRPDRLFAKRAEQHWFPYDLLNLETTDEGRSYYIGQSKARSLVIYQNIALPLKNVAELDPPELIWTTMMFDLIIERFWRQDYSAPALSYTAEMLHQEQVLSGTAQAAELPVGSYQPLALRPLTISDVRTEAVTADEVGTMARNPNEWMEARYAERTNVDALNLVSSPDETYQLSFDTGEISKELPDDGLTPFTGKQRAAVTIRTMDATAFGTREALARDRLFVGRHNLAVQISMLAQEEYEARKDEVNAWFRSRVEQNLDALLAWAKHTEIWVSDGEHPMFTSYRAKSAPPSRYTDHRDERHRGPGGLHHFYHAFLKRIDLSDAHHDRAFGAYHLGQRRDGKLLCLLNGTKASYAVGFNPATSAELAALAGCQVSELPDVLQQWELLDIYTGNSNLRRIDPMIWATKNPWLDHDFRVRIPLSKRAMSQIEKATGNTLPDIPNIDTTCVRDSRSAVDAAAE